MTTTVSPSLGHSPLFTQGGVGSAPGYDAIDLRRMLLVGDLQEGAVEAGAYKVTQRGAGANMSVDIAASTGSCVVQGDAVAQQGLYPVPAHSAVINELVTAAHATLPRIDQVVLELQDNTHDSSGGNLARTRVIDGTATAGATLDNRLGVAALPSSCMRLADVLVPAAATSLTTASNIRDRRQWARGAKYLYTRASTDYTTTSGALVTLDGTNLAPRLELSGAPVRVSLAGRILGSVSTAAEVALLYDSVQVFASRGPNGGSGEAALSGEILGYQFTPSAGSHVFGVQWRTVNAATLTFKASATDQMSFCVQELVTQNTSNG